MTDYRSETPPDATLEHAKIIREMIRHEDEVIDQRFTWLCQIQGFLFAALAFAWKEPTADYLVLLLCLLGTSVAMTSLVSLRNATSGQKELLYWWDSNKPAGYTGPDVFARRIYCGKWMIKTKYWQTWQVLPVIFSLAWIMVLIIRLWEVLVVYLH